LRHSVLDTESSLLSFFLDSHSSIKSEDRLWRHLRDRPLRSTADIAKAKAFEAETQYGIFAPCLQVKRLTDLITDYNAKGIPIPSFIKYQPYPIVRIYKITDRQGLKPTNKTGG